jgi:serine/threonine protein kinase
MRYLGQGKEGKAAVYIDTFQGESVVIKTYFGHGKIALPRELRDVLGHHTSRWPNEIEASLLLGDSRADNHGAFVPVLDFFLLHTQDQSWHWALVTPLIKEGTLLSLASRIRAKGGNSIQKLDEEFRPVLHRTLDALGSLHGRGYCHDDIKADNLFVLNPQHWLLGDLGQVRQFAHPWHETKTWSERNQWSDCRLNDVRRLLKSYLVFLREASADPQAFDLAFSQGSESWGRLYWSWMDKPILAEHTVELSRRIGLEVEVEQVSEQKMHSLGMCLRWSVERELRCTSIQLHWHEFLSYWHC